jgi:biopolymer transport protein ExbD
MRFSEAEHDDTQIELTPLIDVVFLLLIFFMVSTTFSRESSIQIDLPEATERAEQTDEPLRVEVLVSKDSSYAIRAPGEETARALLNKQRITLLRAVSEYSDMDILLVIRADRLAPHEAVMQVMDVAKSLGIARLSFSARLTTEDEDSN